MIPDSQYGICVAWKMERQIGVVGGKGERWKGKNAGDVEVERRLRSI